MANLRIFEPQESTAPARNRRTFFQTAVAITGLGLGAGLALNYDSETPPPPTKQMPTLTQVEVQELHKAEPTLVDFETTKALTIAYANFANQLAIDSNFLREVPHYERKNTSETLSNFREKANSAAYLFTLEERYLTPRHKVAIDGKVKTDALQELTANNYQIQAVKDLFSPEQEQALYNLTDQLSQQIKTKPDKVSRKAVQTYAELMSIMFKSDSSNNKQDDEALAKTFSLMAQYLEKHADKTTDADLQYFEKLLSLTGVLNNYGKDFNSRKIQEHLSRLTQMLESDRSSKVAVEGSATKL